MNGQELLPNPYLLPDHPAGGGSYTTVPRDAHLQARDLSSGYEEPVFEGHYLQGSQDNVVEHGVEIAYSPPHSTRWENHPSHLGAEQPGTLAQQWNGHSPTFQYSVAFALTQYAWL